MTGVILAGAVSGVGLLLLVLAGQPSRLRGAGAVDDLVRLDRDLQRLRQDVGRDGAVGVGPPGPLPAAVTRLLRQVSAALPTGLQQALDLVERPAQQHVVHTVAAGAGGGLFAVAISGMLVAVLQIPAGSVVLLPVLLGLVAAALPTVAVLRRAGVARRDLRHVVGCFLDLVALNLAGGRGVPEALGTAASVSQGWAMVRIRRSVQDARLHGSTPWAALGELGRQAGVQQLQDLAAALELVADDGAKVRESLGARASSLRRQELADSEGRAQARSQSMLLAQLLLAIGFLIFLIYPAIVRVLSA